MHRSFVLHYQQEFVVFLTRLSGSGRATIAQAMCLRLLEATVRLVSLFNGNVTGKHLGWGLGFTTADKLANVRRSGFVASEVVCHRGIAICAAIALYRVDQEVNGGRISASGGYVEMFVNAPLEVCEERDVRGLYVIACAGAILDFAG